MAFCTNCGANIPDNMRFCTECGAKLDAPVQAAAAAQPAPAYVPAPAPQPRQAEPRQAQPRQAEPVQAAPRRRDPRNIKPAPGGKYSVVGTGAYFGLILLFSIPVLGWIACAIMAFAVTNENIKHLARAYLIWLLVGIVLCLAFYLIFASYFKTLTSYFTAIPSSLMGGITQDYGAGSTAQDYGTGALTQPEEYGDYGDYGELMKALGELNKITQGLEGLPQS